MYHRHSHGAARATGTIAALSAVITIVGCAAPAHAIGFGNHISDGPSTAQAATASQTFNYTGASQTVTVPDDTSSVSLVIVGATGGTANKHGGGFDLNDYGGVGAKVSGTLAVTPGQTLTLYVGGQGGDNNGNSSPGNGGWSCSGGYSGGKGASSKGGSQIDGPGGGGASAVPLNGSAVVIAAGGGGGWHVGEGGASGGFWGSSGAGGGGNSLYSALNSGSTVTKGERGAGYITLTFSV